MVGTGALSALMAEHYCMHPAKNGVTVYCSSLPHSWSERLM
jgi:hypothetical protein